MNVPKKEKPGTIFDLPILLANIAQQENVNPVSKKDKQTYIKFLEKYKMFKSKASQKEKNEIVSKLKVVNIDENQLARGKRILKSVLAYNRIIDKKLIEVENEIRSGKNVKVNELIRKKVEKVEIDIPRNIRTDLNVQDKAVILQKFDAKEVKNDINFYSGLKFSFRIKDGFNRPYYVPYETLQKKRIDGNVVEFLLNQFKQGVENVMEKDRLMYEKSEPKKWHFKTFVYDKILNEVLAHNISIATNKDYNEPFVKRDKDGKISKIDSKVPILMILTGTLIDLYIP